MYGFDDYDEYDYMMDIIDSGGSMEEAARPWEMWDRLEEALEDLNTHRAPVGRHKTKNQKQSAKDSATERSGEVAGASGTRKQRKKSRGRRGKKQRPAVIRIVPAAGRSYADVYMAVRNSALAAVEDQIKPPQRIAKDTMMVRCKRGADSDAIVSRIEAALGDLGTVVVSESEVTGSDYWESPDEFDAFYYDDDYSDYCSDEDALAADKMLKEHFRSMQKGFSGLNIHSGQGERAKTETQKQEPKVAVLKAASSTEPTVETPASTASVVEEGRTEQQQQTSKGDKAKDSKRSRGKKRNTAVIRIVPAAGRTFADMHKAVRVPVLADVEDQIEPPRRVEGDVMMIRCKHGTDSDAIASRIEAALGELGTVAVSMPMTMVVLANLDCMTTAEELQSAILEQHGAAVDTANIRLRGCQNGLKLARVRLPASEAAKITGKQLRVALSVVWAKEEERQQRVPANNQRCSRCMELGHHSRTCQGTDRSGLCFRCGGEGHRAFGCRAAPKCLKCGSDHPTGSPKCTFGVQTAAVETEKQP